MTPVHGRNLFKYTFRLKETKCTIITDKAETVEKSIQAVIYHRNQLEAYIKTHPKFLHSLAPVSADDGPKVARLMASASMKAGVGPMAAVAGALADLAVEEMVSSGARVAIVENGGEISAVSDRPVDVALLAGDSPLSREVGFRLERFPMGVATSSGVFGHALSLGEAEAVTIFSENACIADAVATAACNIVKGEDRDHAVKRAMDKALSIEGVRGVFIIYRGKVGIAGEIPKLVKIVEGR